VSVWQSVRIAVRALRVNTLRSALTMLGIIIGVSAVIAMVGVGAGAQARVAEQIQSLGSNLIIALSGSVTSSGIRLGTGSQLTISEDDASAIAREVPSVQVAAPAVRGTAQVVYGNLNWSTVIQGVTPDYFEARDWPAVDGRQISVEDVDGATKVALVGQTTALNLFGEAEPTGQIIRIKKVPFTVIGMLDRKGQSSWGQDQDDIIMIPISTAKKKVLGTSQASPRSVGSISIKIRPGEDMAEAENQIRALLRQRHRLQPFQDDDFWLRNLSEVLQTQEESSRVMTYLLAAIASVSLLVGGIGIMNIMLVSVTERTREIGLRMAVGARRRHILLQFLIEAVTLSLIGGIAGIALGLSGSRAISYFAEWRTLVAPEAIVLAFGFAAGIGIFFGFYPARKASRLDPIEALRYESTTLALGTPDSSIGLWRSDAQKTRVSEGRPLRAFAAPPLGAEGFVGLPAPVILRTMERARKRLAKRKRPRAPRRPTRVATPRPTPAEKRLLGLSREIARLPLAAALGKLAAAWAPGGPLLYEVATAWTESRGNKTSALALAWAREQVRLSLQEIIEATPKDKRGRIEATPETLAWVVLAGCEALAHEPPSAVADRVHALLELTGHAAPGD